MSANHPPRLAEWLLTRSLADSDHQAVLGDLYEEFGGRVMHDGIRSASRWYWQQTLRSILPNLIRQRALSSRPAAVRGGSLMQSTWIDLRFAWRMVRRNPLVTLVAVTSLIVGMTGSTVVFGLLNAVSFRSLPLEHAEELALVLEQRDGGVNRNFMYRDFTDFRTAQQTMTDLVAYAFARPVLRLENGSEPVSGELVSSNYFATFGVPMRLGRGLGPADDDRSAPPVIVVSETFWRRLGGSPRVFDTRSVVLNGESFAIVGVAAYPFRGMQVGRDARFWAPVHFQRVLEPADGADFTTQTTVSWLTLMGRLRPGVSAAQVAEDLNRIEAELPRTPNRPQPRRLFTKSGRQGDSSLPAAAAAPLQLLLGAAGLLMLVACANVAGLQVTRAVERDRELSVRAALGASRGQLARLLLTEALILGVAATLLTAGTSIVLTRLAVPLIDLFGTSLTLDVTPDWRVWSFVGGLGLVATMFFGLLPLLASGPRSLGGTLTEGARVASPGGRRALLRRGLVVTQFAVSLALAVCAVLFIRTMNHLKSLPTGFDLDRIAVLEVDPTAPTAGTVAPERVAQYLNDTLASLSSVPGVRAAGYARILPLDFGGMRSSIVVPGYQPAANEDMEINLNRVSPGYFAAMGLKALDGRLFEAADVRGAPLVTIVNETMARRFWANQRAVGQTITLGERPFTVIGVVPDVKYRQLRESSGPSFYLATAQGSPSPGAFHVLTAGPADSLVETLRRRVAAVDPRIPVIRAHSMRAQADLHVSKERLAMTIAVVLAGAALLLAAVGLYGAMSHAVGSRTREIGVRVAMGAVSGDIRRLVLRQGLALVAIGSVLGIALSVWLAGTIEHLLYGVRPTDVASMAGAIAVLTAVALLATWMPARRAARIDPVIALRD